MKKKACYNPAIHHRRSIRLKGYDYAKAGLYYITLNCQDRARLFGEFIVCPDESYYLKLNAAGTMIEKWYRELESKFPTIRCHDMIVMPDHFHCVIEITDEAKNAIRPDVPTIIQWFKTMTTNEYIREAKQSGWLRFNGKLWQRNYYESIIRDANAYHNISNYIIDNPRQWVRDHLKKKQYTTQAIRNKSTGKKNLPD